MHTCQILLQSTSLFSACPHVSLKTTWRGQICLLWSSSKQMRVQIVTVRNNVIIDTECLARVVRPGCGVVWDFATWWELGVPWTMDNTSLPPSGFLLTASPTVPDRSSISFYPDPLRPCNATPADPPPNSRHQFSEHIRAYNTVPKATHFNQSQLCRFEQRPTSNTGFWSIAFWGPCAPTPEGLFVRPAFHTGAKIGLKASRSHTFKRFVKIFPCFLIHADCSRGSLLVRIRNRVLIHFRTVYLCHWKQTPKQQFRTLPGDSQCGDVLTRAVLFMLLDHAGKGKLVISGYDFPR